MDFSTYGKENWIQDAEVVTRDVGEIMTSERALLAWGARLLLPNPGQSLTTWRRSRLMWLRRLNNEGFIDEAKAIDEMALNERRSREAIERGKEK